MSAAERKQHLLEAIRQGGGEWDATRAWAAYDVRPENRKEVRRDLQALYAAGLLRRVRIGVYVAAPIQSR
jgi:DeoR/GlpR family transcriptional regulator of sugar metabolism